MIDRQQRGKTQNQVMVIGGLSVESNQMKGNTVPR